MTFSDLRQQFRFIPTQADNELFALDARRQKGTRRLLVLALLAAYVGVYLAWGLDGLLALAPLLFVCEGFRFPFDYMAPPYFAERGYDRMNLSHWRLLANAFGGAAIRDMPPWPELQSLPGADPERQYESVRNVLVAKCWQRDPAHADLLMKGYLKIDDEQANALYAAFGEDAIRSLPNATAMGKNWATRNVTQFEFALGKLERRWGTKLANREALLARGRNQSSAAS